MDIKDQRRQFLEELALAPQYNFYGDTHTAFLGRFAYEQADIPNNRLRLNWAKDHVDKGQKLQDELKKIYPVLRRNGCEIPETKQGRYKKGESPWELAYAWLWRIKFPEWQTLQAEEEKSTETPVLKKESLDWRGICGQMLAEQKQLTTNAFTNADGVNLQREEIYVPLAIVERKPPKPQPRNAQEEKEEEKLIPIAEESFFEEVLRSGQSSSQGRRIAVIGEPGSGKTTRLQKIADWILEQGLGLPIWISLADLTQPTIAQYIEEFWLKQTGQSLTIEELTQQKDQIWLLLDGVDEMTSRVETRHVSALLGGWLQAVRVVVSCRVNVWEADKNAFSGFDVFRNLEFSPEQVQDYIRCWFTGAGDGATGEDLDRALTQSENYRLKELIQNPLRLWMLCHIWYRNRGGLPETQAELYGQFVDRVYDWKADEEILDQREAIDAALAKLALAAMEQQDEVSRFRLRESWVLKKLGSRQIFEAVKRLGWLNRVERSPEAICVFYHATFQEYFAALGVEDWDYFLPRDHESSPVEEKKYRIFEPQWKQVILLWLGRNDLADEQKEEFIEKLVNFDDGCGEWNFEQVDKGLYEYRAYFLAAEGLSEYESQLSNEIIENIVNLSFGYLISSEAPYLWLEFLTPVTQSARKIIVKSNAKKVIKYLYTLLDLLQSIYDLNFILVAMYSDFIEKENPSYEQLNKFWSELINTVFLHLAKIDFNNYQNIPKLFNILEISSDLNNCRLAADILGKIALVNPEVIDTLIDILEQTNNPYAGSCIPSILVRIGQRSSQATNNIKPKETEQGNTRDIDTLLKAIETSGDLEVVRRLTVGLLLDGVGQASPESIALWIKYFENPDLLINRRYNGKPIKFTSADNIAIATIVLEKIGQGNHEVINYFVKILKTTENGRKCCRAANVLEKIDPGNSEPIKGLVRILRTTENESTDIEGCYQALWNIAQDRYYPDFYHAWHSPPE